MSKSKAHTVYKNKVDKRVPGVTTITGLLAKPALIGWANKMGLAGIDTNKYVDDKADIGKLAHAIITDHLVGKKTNTDDYSKNQISTAENSVLSYYEWEKHHKIRVIFVEEPLVSEKHQYGGTVDIYAEVDGVLEIIDLKTGSGIYPEHFYQVAAYKNLLKEYGHQVERARILDIPRSEDESFQDRFVPKIDVCFDIFKGLRNVDGLIKQMK